MFPLLLALTYTALAADICLTCSDSLFHGDYVRWVSSYNENEMVSRNA